MRAILFRSLNIVLIYIGVGGLSYLSYRRVPQKDNVIKMPSIYLIIGIGGSVVFGVVSIVLTILNHDPASLVLFGFLILSVPLIIAYFQCRMYYTNEEIISRNFFGKTKRMRYAEIKRIINRPDIILKTDSDSLTIPSYYTGYIEFLYVLGKANTKLTKRVEKCVKNSPVRPFREAVWRYKEFIFMYIFMFVFLVASGIMIWVVDKGQITNHMWFPGGGLIFWSVTVFLSVHSAKRAHASPVWAAVAKLFFRDGYLNL